MIDPNHDPSFCDSPDDKKPHVHKGEGDPSCSAHGMMHQPQKNWLCLDRDCKVKWQPKGSK